MFFFRFADALLKPEVRGQFLYMPSEVQQMANISAVYEKYKLRNVIAGVDGCHIPFYTKPRKIPQGRDPENFRNRKGFWSLNAQIVGEGCIFFISLGKKI